MVLAAALHKLVVLFLVEAEAASARTTLVLDHKLGCFDLYVVSVHEVLDVTDLHIHPVFDGIFFAPVSGSPGA